jgi:hypothetical protein
VQELCSICTGLPVVKVLVRASSAENVSRLGGWELHPTPG